MSEAARQKIREIVLDNLQRPGCGRGSWTINPDKVAEQILASGVVVPVESVPSASGNSTAPYAGSNKDRQEVGLAGHCERCAEVGHVRAHPDLGCGDVGCNSPHSPDQEEGPDDGHTFRISVIIRGSGIVVGDEHHTDAPHFDADMPFTVDVRAWSLADAMRKASTLPLHFWTLTEPEDSPCAEGHVIPLGGDACPCRMFTTHTPTTTASGEIIINQGDNR